MLMEDGAKDVGSQNGSALAFMSISDDGKAYARMEGQCGGDLDLWLTCTACLGSRGR